MPLPDPLQPGENPLLASVIAFGEEEVVGLLRIHFTADDLARTTMAAAADPLWEVVLSRFRLRDRDKALAYRSWERGLRRSPERVARMGAGVRWLMALAPEGPYFPDFLTPEAARDGLEAGLSALRSTPRRRFRWELGWLARYAPVAGWVGGLGDGEVTSVEGLATALSDYYGAAIAPHGEHIRAAVEADRAWRVGHLLSGGVEALLNGLRPTMRWRPPVLEVDYTLDRDLHLHGRGLRLVPSYFCRRVPVALADPELSPVLVYPIDAAFRWTPGTRAPGSLEALVGDSRAAVLQAARGGATTTELARRAGVSIAAASRHAKVLREAGLVRSVRRGPAVLHLLTPLGTGLLEPS
ncbi:ArsR/SmtB family transcription factor [Nonomuraea jiangxiensis]|uniref:Helix-turn-helix domain-containing protein n=1 Tax=Nonomuraea jiangxiensis TaxID=633440 RepID=A0A1G9AZ48_9ACTN|nr:winged helix-turn-helix domain-containing protein [Nonomuraea jiangxiensis]SDK32542.1 Helix-turn-helix domain-containing protein [Nonomuraea jiangxiensis]